MITIPDQFSAHIATVFDDGATWLAQLPQQVAELEQRWSITVHEPFELSYNYVVDAVRADGTPVVLKVGVPRAELTREIDAVRHYNGRGMARLLAADAAQGALLLERLYPGQMLSALDDDEKMTRIAAQVMGELFEPPPDGHAFRPISEWTWGLKRLRATFNGGTGVFPKRLVEMAEQFFADLLDAATDTVLIHGDLHHFNILSAGDGWLAIDPKGMTGEPAFEPGTFLRNHLESVYGADNPLGMMERRIAIFAEMLALDCQKITRYALAQAVLSVWWTYEDNGTFNDDWLRCARLFEQLI